MEDLGISAPSVPVDTGAVSTYVEPTTPSADVMNEMSDLLDGDSPIITSEPVYSDKGNDIPPPAAAAPAAQPDPNAPPAADPAQPSSSPAADAATAGEPGLPEGVRLRTIDGKKAMVMDPEKGQAAFARASLVDQAEQTWGEPVTPESIKFRQEMIEGFEHMRSDMISDNPADQAKVVDHLSGIIEQAAKNGEIGHEAFPSFVNVAIDKVLGGPQAGTVLNHIADRLLGAEQLPPAVLEKAAGHQQVLKSVIEGVYLAALTEKDPALATALWNSAQQIEVRKFGPGNFRPMKEMEYLKTTGATTLPTYQRGEAAKPAAAAASQAQPAQQAANTPTGTNSPEAEQAFKAWGDAADKAIHQEAVVKHVDAALDLVIDKTLKEQYPNFAASARSALVKAVQDGFKNDPTLRGQVAVIQKRARFAVNPEIRNQLQSSVIKLHAQKALQILNEKKGPILSEYTALLRAKSNETASRANASQRAGRQAAPSHGPSASRQAAPPRTNGKFASNTAFTAELDTALA